MITHNCFKNFSSVSSSLASISLIYCFVFSKFFICISPPFSFIERLFVFNIHYLHLKCNIFPQTFVRFYFCFYLLYEFQRALFNSVTQSSSVLDTFYYLYGESNKSEILTFNAFAIFSRLSSVGEYFPVAILLIVDLGIPVAFESCRTDTSFSYMIFVSNIFMRLLFTKIHCLFYD